MEVFRASSEDAPLPREAVYADPGPGGDKRLKMNKLEKGILSTVHNMVACPSENLI